MTNVKYVHLAFPAFSVRCPCLVKIGITNWLELLFFAHKCACVCVYFLCFVHFSHHSLFINRRFGCLYSLQISLHIRNNVLYACKLRPKYCWFVLTVCHSKYMFMLCFVSSCRSACFQIRLVIWLCLFSFFCNSDIRWSKLHFKQKLNYHNIYCTDPCSCIFAK